MVAGEGDADGAGDRRAAVGAGEALDDAADGVVDGVADGADADPSGGVPVGATEQATNVAAVSSTMRVVRGDRCRVTPTGCRVTPTRYYEFVLSRE